MAVPTIEHPTGNANFSRITTADERVLYFSYSTCIAFADGGMAIVQENTWSQTTGQHLNYIDGGGPKAKARRVDSATFETLLNGSTKK